MLGKRRKRDHPPGENASPESDALSAPIPTEKLPYGSESKAEAFGGQAAGSAGEPTRSPLARVASDVVLQLSDGVYAAAEDGSILDANPALLHMLGVTDVQAIGKRTFESFLSELPDRRRGEVPEGVLRLTSPSGLTSTIRHHRVSVSGWSDIAHFGLVREMPGLFDKAMLENQRLTNLGTLAAKVIHDINNLLLAILGNSDRLLDGGKLDEEQRTGVDHIIQASNRAAELASELLSYASSGKSAGIVREVDLSALVEETTRLLDIVIPHNVTLRYTLDRDLPKLQGDAVQLRRLVMNLVLNACEALEGAPGTVTVETGVSTSAPSWPSGSGSPTPLRGFATIEVSDTGKGMDEPTRRRIFEPFFTSKESGQGLGLATVAEILRLHHGSISVVSSPGQGSTFRAYLPVA
jgi:signal transduction histidine kinase